MRQFKKLNQGGIAHQVVLLGVVVALAIGAVGYKVLGAGHAYVAGGTVSCSISGPSTVKHGQSFSTSLTIGNGNGYKISPSVNFGVTQYALTVATPVYATSLGTISVPARSSATKSLGTMYASTNKAVTKYVLNVTGSAPSFSCSKTVLVQN